MRRLAAVLAGALQAHAAVSMQLCSTWSWLLLGLLPAGALRCASFLSAVGLGRVAYVCARAVLDCRSAVCSATVAFMHACTQQWLSQEGGAVPNASVLFACNTLKTMQRHLRPPEAPERRRCLFACLQVCTARSHWQHHQAICKLLTELHRSCRDWTHLAVAAAAHQKAPRRWPQQCRHPSQAAALVSVYQMRAAGGDAWRRAPRPP